MSIWKENYQLMLEIRNFSTTYCTFVESGGKAGDFDQALVNKVIALATKIKENRDYVDEYLGKEIPTVKQECDYAMGILNGTVQEDRIHSVIRRIM